VIVAGEPGGSIPATRALIEAGWGARVIDHHGLTEVGPIGVECPAEPRTLQVLETEYLVEVLDPGKLSPTPVGQVGELVVTNLGRWGSPLIRYRTGDLVQAGPIPARGGRRFVGGVLGRADDMLHVRGNNVYPAALEAVVRRFAEVAEFRIIVDQTGAMTELLVQLEPTPTASPELAERVQQALRDELLFRIDVTTVAVGSLPRFEMKAKRVEYRR
jgi:phenylacetate-CoA ligase